MSARMSQWIADVVAFLRDLRDPDVYGFAVTAEVRAKAASLADAMLPPRVPPMDADELHLDE